ncbi:hypothetical protein MMIC_P2049 [Mariprofundus micogutta]|uniref:AMMECR1 domain-containing protein n=1 Tax=Mariprofundus micogutta TaxID=1921010 RepID=A0A1L8CQ68_9PROT|nr:AmmeMemoRadiSam system protein A [Mariprofundus micogutta]GAV21070.1 hypothetical protein MMIC_P2049 [Mariprofundus micogutta]
MSESVNKGRLLTGIARAAIARQLDLAAGNINTDGIKWLQEPGASFVTLYLQGVLRGCIGSLETYRSLLEDVSANAVASAFHDHRFAPLTADEFANVQIEVSVLSSLEAMHARNESIALSKLRPGVDGVVFKFGLYKATFLPQVWTQIPEAKEFLGQLKVKAGLSADFWHPEVLLYKYQVNKFREQEHSKE